jgi:hypothetical protein
MRTGTHVTARLQASATRRKQHEVIAKDAIFVLAHLRLLSFVAV